MTYEIITLSNKATDISGKQYGLLTVVVPVGRNKARCILWLCICKCGTESVVSINSLNRGKTKSCGCKSAEAARKNGCKNKTHGMSRTPEYGIWSGIRGRCNNPTDIAYKNYGGRGISVSDSWDDFGAFLKDVGRRPSLDYSIDRYPDNDGNYEPGNVRWATQKEQMNNTRINRYITYKGRTKTVAMWAESTGIRSRAIRSRIDKLGWSVERALTTPTGNKV